MRQIRQSMAMLLLAVVGLVGCAHEPRAVEDANPARVADTKAALRDLWAGHIFWIRNVVLDNATNNPAARDAAEKEVVANAKQIAEHYAVLRRGGIGEASLPSWPATMARSKNIPRPPSPGIRASRMLPWPT